MTQFEYTGNAVQTSLGANILAADLSIPIGAATGWPLGAGSDVFTATIGDPANGDTLEKVLVASRSGTTLTITTRGYEGTSAQDWAQGTLIRHTISSTAMNEASDHVADGTLHMTDAEHAAIVHTQAMMGTGSVGQAQLLDDSVGAGEIIAGAVGPTELATDAVVAGKIADGAIDNVLLLTTALRELLCPTGKIVAYGGAAAPTGWGLCDGGAISRTTFADLFAVLGTTYGAGDGSTTFNKPDLRQRFPLGKAASGTGSVLGATGGTIDHVHGLDTASSHARISQAVASGNSIASARRTGVTGWNSTQETTTATSGNNTDARTIGTQLGGNSDVANPPFQVVNYIIKL